MRRSIAEIRRAIQFETKQADEIRRGPSSAVANCRTIHDAFIDVLRWVAGDPGTAYERLMRERNQDFLQPGLEVPSRSTSACKRRMFGARGWYRGRSPPFKTHSCVSPRADLKPQPQVVSCAPEGCAPEGDTPETGVDFFYSASLSLQCARPET